MMSTETQCCSPSPFNSTFQIEKMEVSASVKPKEIVILLMMLMLFIMSICSFFKHWKKNYYDNSETIPTFYNQPLSPSPVRDFPCSIRSGSISLSSPHPRPSSRRNTLLSPHIDYNQFNLPVLSISATDTPPGHGYKRINRAHSMFTPRPKRAPLLSTRYGSKQFNRQYSVRPTKKHRNFLSEDSGSISIEIPSPNNSSFTGSRHPSSQQILTQKIEEELEEQDESEIRRMDKDDLLSTSQPLLKPELDLIYSQAGNQLIQSNMASNRLEQLRNRLRLNVQETLIGSTFSSFQDTILQEPGTPESSEGWNMIQIQATVEHCPTRPKLERADSIFQRSCSQNTIHEPAPRDRRRSL